MNTASTSIHPETAIGYVHLTVSDLGRSLAFYQYLLGFRLHRRDGNTAHLGAGSSDLLLLTEQPGAHPRPPRTTGLYHFAILVPSRADLARALSHLVETHTTLQGLSDHLVSEAIYLADPDGNGIEIYSDRPRDAWQFEGTLVSMATQPLDVDGLLSELSGRDEAWSGLSAESSISCNGTGRRLCSCQLAGIITTLVSIPGLALAHHHHHQMPLVCAPLSSVCLTKPNWLD